VKEFAGDRPGPNSGKATLILRGWAPPEFVKGSGNAASKVKVVEKVVFRDKVVEKIVEKMVPQKEPSVEVRGTKRLLRTIPNK
jgi:hypothetical protein